MKLKLCLLSLTERVYICCIIVFFACYLNVAVCYACGGTLMKPSGTIKMPNMSALLNDTNRLCEWRICLNTTSSRRLELQFETFNLGGQMPKCVKGSSLEIFLGCSEQSIGRYCSLALLPVIYSVDGCLKLKFRWEGFEFGSSFVALYRAKPLQEPVSLKETGCGVPPTQENVMSSNIYSPKWPQPYPRYVECLWSLKTLRRRRMILIIFDSDIDSSSGCPGSDLLDIRVGIKNFVTATGIHEQHCGKRKPFVLDIRHEAIYIKFTTDGSGSGRGFMAGVVTYTTAEDTDFSANVWIASCLVLFVLVLFATKVLMIRGQTPRKTTKSCTERGKGDSCFSICHVERICLWLQFSKPTFTRTHRTGKISSEQNIYTMKDISQNEANRSRKTAENSSSGPKKIYNVEFELASFSTRTDTEGYVAHY